MSAGEYLRYSAEGSAIAFVFLFLFYNRLQSSVLLIPFVFFYMKYKKKQLLKNRRELLLYRFPDFLAALQSSLRTGYSLENAVSESTRELKQQYGKEDLLVRELTEIQRQIRMSIPVEKLFTDLGKRSRLEDLEDFAEVLNIGKRTGGNFDQILERTFWILSDKIETRKEIDAATAAKRYEFLIMSVVPLGIILYMRVSFRGFLDPLYGNPFGICFMSICLLVYGAAWKAGRKIAEIEV